MRCFKTMLNNQRVSGFSLCLSAAYLICGLVLFVLARKVALLFSDLLHEKFGFQKVAHLQQVGQKFNQRFDAVYLQLLLAPNQSLEPTAVDPGSHASGDAAQVAGRGSAGTFDP